MTETPIIQRPSSRPDRFRLPTLVGGLVVGALVMAAVAPLVGTERGAELSAGAPDFLEPGGQADPGLGADGSSAVDEPTGGDDVVDGGDAGAPDSGGAAQGGGGAGGATDTGGAGSTPAAGGGQTSVPRTASDIGITENTIRIGAMTLKCEGCAAVGIGLGDATSHERIAQAFVDEINDRGGIHGRKLDLFTANYDPATDSAQGGGSERAGCVELTEEHKVFAVVMGGYNTNKCIFEEHETPLITHADPNLDDPGAFNRSEGRIWMFEASADRLLTDWARQLQSLRLLEPATKWGIVYGEGSTLIERRFLPEMKRLGFTPAHVSKLPGDPSSATVKIAQEVPKMRSKGVTHVLLAENFVYTGNWVRESQRNGWKPQYLVSEYPNGANDFTGGQNHTGADWTGAIAISTGSGGSASDLRQDPVMKPCLETFQKRSGIAPSDDDLSWIASFCVSLRLFEQAMNAAGPNPTRQDFLQAMAATGEFPLVTLGGKGRFGGPYAFGPARWTAKEFVQQMVWKSPCPTRGDNDNACYVAVGEPIRMAA